MALAPTTVTIFGGTGDLVRRKVIPSLYFLFEKGELPKQIKIVGFSRRDLTEESYRGLITEVIATHLGKQAPKSKLTPFLKLFHFQRGDFDEPESYEGLKKIFDSLDQAWGVRSNKLFYLSVAPEFYETIFKQLAKWKLTHVQDADNAWVRVMVEKPFGVDMQTARRLDVLLAQYFKEEQIYRIDHYLAKEMLQNILIFRFANNLFSSWGKENIERVHIRLLEEIGVEKRGAFYDPIGAFRDVGQNHFLQMLALIAMEHPRSFDARAIQNSRANILEKLILHTSASARKKTFRAQHEGYRDILGVSENSNTETFFNVRAELDDPTWAGVPFYLIGGKRLGKAEKEIVITLKHTTPCLCPTGDHHQNVIIIRLEPKEEILIEFWSKKPGFSMQTEPRMFHFLLREAATKRQYVEEYARILLEGIRGDQIFFISTREVKAMWRFADPILKAWKKDHVPLHTYVPDTKDILHVSKVIEN